MSDGNNDNGNGKGNGGDLLVGLGIIALAVAGVCIVGKAIAKAGKEPPRNRIKRLPAQIQKKPAETLRQRERKVKDKAKSCREAENEGKNVCWNCLTINPSHCYCGSCLVCAGDAGGGECQSCSSDD